MGLSRKDVVDAIGTDIVSGATVLNIIDDWDWSDERKHLIALQEKLNAYFDFVESGQLEEASDWTVGDMLRVNIVFRFQPTEKALAFLDLVTETALSLNTQITSEVYDGATPFGQ